MAHALFLFTLLHILKNLIYRQIKSCFSRNKTFDKMVGIEYPLCRELATECVSVGVDAEKACQDAGLIVALCRV